MDRRQDKRKFIAKDVLNPVYYNDRVGIGPFRHIQKVQKFLEPFYGLPINEIAPFTTKFCYLQGSEDFVAVKDYYSKRMRDIGLEFCRIVDPDVKFSYRFEWSLTTAKDAIWDMPLSKNGVSSLILLT
ncbi:MAG: hypothetical protein N4A61_06230 [Pelagimonas sp.]|jgi:hypothetical protein|nr:hypothetical protein [Pelagimonas sp.]